MTLEGTIRDLGLQEVGQLLALGRKSGVLAVRSTLRGAAAWIRFAAGAIVDAGPGAPPGPLDATPAAAAGDRPAVEEAVLDILAWREGLFAFAPAVMPGGRGAPVGASRVRIPTDAMLVESARREDAWSRLRDRVPSAEVVPAFVDVEPKALPLLHLVPQEWEVLTRVDGERTLRTLAHLLQRDVVAVAEIVHGLVGTGLLTVRDGSVPLAPASGAPPVVDAATLAALDGVPAASAVEVDPDDLWIPAPADFAGYDTEADDAILDLQRPGPQHDAGGPTGTGARTPAVEFVASTPVEPSSDVDRREPARSAASEASALREAGDAAARRGDFASALDRWTRYLEAHGRAPDADRVREAIGLAGRLQALLPPVSRD